MKKDEVNKIGLPEQGPNTRVVNGVVVADEMENETTLYIAHETEQTEDGEFVRAFAFNVPNPVTRAKAIDAAEREAYGLHNVDEVASFNAALARKSRQGVDEDEVADHDQFIDWVKVELTKIGVCA